VLLFLPNSPAVQLSLRSSLPSLPLSPSLPRACFYRLIASPHSFCLRSSRSLPLSGSRLVSSSFRFCPGRATPHTSLVASTFLHAFSRPILFFFLLDNLIFPSLPSLPLSHSFACSLSSGSFRQFVFSPPRFVSPLGSLSMPTVSAGSSWNGIVSSASSSSSIVAHQAVSAHERRNLRHTHAHSEFETNGAGWISCKRGRPAERRGCMQAAVERSCRKVT
jgi:hypothetical protein